MIKEKKNSNQNSIDHVLENTFFYRQIYNVTDDNFYPSLEPTCFCHQIFNPDKNFLTCKECKELIHVKCFVESKSVKCSKCTNLIQIQLQKSGLGISEDFETFYIKNQKKENILSPQSENLIGNKRPRENSEDDNNNNAKKIINEHNLNFANKDNISVYDKIKSPDQLINIQLEKKGGNEEKINYPNLSEERRKYLNSLIEKLENSNNNDFIEKNLSSDEKSRRIFRNKISYALVT